MKNAFLFNGLDIDRPTKEKLNERISNKLDRDVAFAREPIEYDVNREAYSVHVDGVVSEGLYSSKEQAIIAIALFNVQPNTTYQELYKLSKFIVQGLQ